jgi:transaldolase
LAGHLFLSFAQAAAAAQAGASVVQIFVGRIRVNSSSIFVTHAKMLILC